MLSLINDLLDLAKIESGKVELNLEPVVCQSVMQDVATSLRPAAERKGLRFELVVPSEKLSCDTRSAFAQPNSHQPGQQRHQVHRTRARCGFELAQCRDGERKLTQISIADTGIGMTAEAGGSSCSRNSHRPMPSTAQRFGGTGLGLAITRKLARMMGGDVTVARQAGQRLASLYGAPAGGARCSPRASIGVVVPTTALDAVDGSSTGTRCAAIWSHLE